MSDILGTAIFLGIVFYFFVRPFLLPNPMPNCDEYTLPEGYGSQGPLDGGAL